MKIVNGKLFGQTKSDLDIFKEYQIQCNIDINASLQEIKERCQSLEQEQSKLQKVEQKWEYLETTRLSQIEKKLLNVKRLIPRKLIWFTLSSSLFFGAISLFSWLDIYPTKNSPQEAKQSQILYLQPNRKLKNFNY